MPHGAAVLGIHHVTAIASSAQQNLSFYAGLLGLRLVKRTVNFDDPATYHLYYGDELGRPGSILTFFPWEGMRRGRVGTGQVARTAFSVPAASLSWWAERLTHYGHAVSDAAGAAGRRLAFHDPDGLGLELAGDADPAGGGWSGGPVPARHAIRRIGGITIWTEDGSATIPVLTGLLGFAPRDAAEPDLRRFTAGTGEPGEVATAEVRMAPDQPHGLMGAGTVHHVAFRAADSDAQLALRGAIEAAGLEPTPVIDRQYFRSVYFREPGGVLFEIATDAPGFTIDESPDQLGTTLRLPPWLRPQRAQIEAALPPLDTSAITPRQGVAGAP